MKNQSLTQRQQRQKDYLKQTSLVTQAIRAGTVSGVEQEHNDAIYATSSFIYGSAKQASECFSGQTEGNIYSRFTNPTVRTFEQRMAMVGPPRVHAKRHLNELIRAIWQRNEKVKQARGQACTVCLRP